MAFALVALAMLATGAAMYFALHRFVQGQVDGRLDGQIASVRDALRVGPDGAPHLGPVPSGPPFDRPGAGWYWKVSGGGAAMRSPSLGDDDFDFDLWPQPPGPLLAPKTGEGRGPRGESLRVRAQTFVVAGASVLVAASAPLHALTGPLREALIPVAFILGALALALIAGVALQVRVGLRPLARLTAALHQVRTGRAASIPGGQPEEIAPLVAELNTLLEQNAANLERARRHVANLAHGLKTPLATLAVALDEDGADVKRLQPLVTTMDRRIRHHLSRARMATLGGPERAHTPLAPRVADHVQAFGRLYADKLLAFDARIDDDLAVACEAQDLDELLGNLIDNACKWARRRIALGAASEGSMIRLTVEDDGPGLSDEAVVEAMLPGRRIDESAPGYGFGLPIARELAELYGGGLRLEKSALGGVKATAILPASRG